MFTLTVWMWLFNFLVRFSSCQRSASSLSDGEDHCPIIVSGFILIFPPLLVFVSSAWLASPVSHYPPPLCLCRTRQARQLFPLASYWSSLFVFLDFEPVLDFCFSSAPPQICLTYWTACVWFWPLSVSADSAELFIEPLQSCVVQLVFLLIRLTDGGTGNTERHHFPTYPHIPAALLNIVQLAAFWMAQQGRMILMRLCSSQDASCFVLHTFVCISVRFNEVGLLLHYKDHNFSLIKTSLCLSCMWCPPPQVFGSMVPRLSLKQVRTMR